MDATVKLGLYGIGLDTYWPQFDGLTERLLGYLNLIRSRLEVDRFREEFEVSDECERAELDRADRTSVALRRVVDAHALGSLAYYYEGQPGNQ